MGLSRRATAAALSLLLIGSWAARGHCPMKTAAATGQRGQAVSAAAAAHDCCKTGLTSVPPACCHAGPDHSPVLMGEGKLTLVANPTPSMLSWAAPSAVHESVELTATAVRAHSPPPTVLRI